MRNETLYETLRRFPLESVGGSYTFAQRLCTENGWTRDYGLAAIEEYKRFLYLARVSPTAVTPSPAVDQVWHLHLLYTRSYWGDLCDGILGRPLHHGPTEGGAEEVEKFTDWYQRALALYREEFGGQPPATIWPAKFSAEKPARWVDTARNWVIPKPEFSSAMRSVFPLLLLGTKVLPVMLILAIAAGLVALLAYCCRGRKSAKKQDGDAGCGAFSGCSSGADSCGDSAGGDCGGGCGGGGCGGGCGGGD